MNLNTNQIDRTNDDAIINIVRSVMDNGTGKAETPNEHILIKLMQLRGTPMDSFDFDQGRADFHYSKWLTEKPESRPKIIQILIGPDNPKYQSSLVGLDDAGHVWYDTGKGWQK